MTSPSQTPSWILFATWCAATGRVPLPATADTVIEFERENLAAPSTARSRRAVIAEVHLEHGHQAPTAGRVTQRHHPPTPDPTAVDAAIHRQPLVGWTAGLFGRRDALLVSLRYKAGITISRLAELMASDVKLENGHLVVDQVAVDRHDDPLLCPGCVWHRWAGVLQLIGIHTTATELKALLRGPYNDVHYCASPMPQPPRTVPLFVPLNRWGSPPLPVQPTSCRSLTTLSNGHLTGTIRPRPVLPNGIDPSPPAAEPPAQVPLYSVQDYETGLQARNDGVRLLNEATDTLEAVEATADALNRRIDQLVTWTRRGTYD